MFLYINVNGVLPVSISQARGLQQGCPLPLLLFNIIIEPLLQSIQSSPLIPSFTNHNLTDLGSVSRPSASSSIKILAYADDMIMLLTQPIELQAFLPLVPLFGNIFNARFNHDKTLAISLLGKQQPKMMPFA